MRDWHGRSGYAQGKMMGERGNAVYRQRRAFTWDLPDKPRLSLTIRFICRLSRRILLRSPGTVSLKALSRGNGDIRYRWSLKIIQFTFMPPSIRDGFTCHPSRHLAVLPVCLNAALMQAQPELLQTRHVARYRGFFVVTAGSHAARIHV